MINTNIISIKRSRIKSITIMTALCFASLLTANVAAAELPKESVLPLALAAKAAQAAVDQCKADGYTVSAAVVDRGGNVRALLRQDGAGPHTVQSSSKKAYTSASMKRSTADLAALVVKMPAVQGLQHMNDHMLLLGGGLPIKIDGEVVGGIGVGGAPGGHLDAACAEAGLKSIGAETKAPEKK
ncbi:MAG: heme-binding protein [Candidatus Nitronauta litoralis]|uniref:Heme-binding protein n=1 Tax=Candidatus Nitronauta litoralis TaxID=2705533 RepID=A0A7T0BZJ0_9BACT|nr:MAG: heme-binding protein [Candidatus Nitronauta litoralis]